MTSEPMALAPPPRWRRWRFGRWFLVATFAFLGYGAWREYDFRVAIKEPKALRWRWEYDDPFDAIQKDWHAAFRKATWTDGTRYLYIPKSAEFDRHVRLVQRLAPKYLVLKGRPELKDLSALKGLSALRRLDLSDCTGLTNVDALKGLSALQQLDLNGCTGLTNVDALKGLSDLQELYLKGCPKLPPKAAAALSAALPNIKIYADPSHW